MLRTANHYGLTRTVIFLVYLMALKISQLVQMAASSPLEAVITQHAYGT
jgi:hypothetical protein